MSDFHMQVCVSMGWCYCNSYQEESMQPHQERVVAELKDLKDKREKLALFIGGNVTFGKLPTDEQNRLRRQFDIMVQYEGVLQERIDHFPA